jgi:hypothetical protein
MCLLFPYPKSLSQRKQHFRLHKSCQKGSGPASHAEGEELAADFRVLGVQLGTAFLSLDIVRSPCHAVHFFPFQNEARKIDHLLISSPSRILRCPHIALVGIHRVVRTGLCRLKLAMTSTMNDDRARAPENEDTPHLTEDKVLRMVILQTETRRVDCFEHILIVGCGSAAEGRYSNNGSDKNWDRRRDSSFDRDRPPRDRFSSSPRRGRNAYRDRDREDYRSPSYDGRSRSHSRSPRDDRNSSMGGAPSKEIIMEGLAAHLTEDDVRSLHPTQAKACLFLTSLVAFHMTVC